MSKNTSSKGKPKPGSKPSAPPRSRNTTPLPNTLRTSAEPPTAASYFSKPLTALSRRCEVTLEDILDRGASSQQQVPSGAALIGMRDQIEKQVLVNVQKRCDVTNTALRELQGLKKNNRSSHHSDKERTPKKDAEEHRQKIKKLGKRAPDEDRPLAVGAHGVARQDGADSRKDNSPSISSPISAAPPSATETAAADPSSPSDSDASHQPAPAPKVPQFQTFGPDPSKFDDPTIYHIREVTPGMSENEIKEIYSVAVYPKDDLRNRTPGTPPDKDFSNAKPASQVNATVFANYVEPYIRPLTEEDVAFLKERGDRVGPFVLPRRGNRPYKEIWAEEDGHDYPQQSLQLPQNEARLSYDEMSDAVLETEDVSTGPLLARLLSTLRPEGRGTSNDANGDAMDIDEGAGMLNMNSELAASQLVDFVGIGWKPVMTNGRTDYATLEERALMELKHYGMISDADTETAAYDSHFDDEVAARLRFLQEELRKQSIINGARKQRLLELTEERIAQQEYNTIADDLDQQLNSAYLKRNRNIGKGKKQAKRPGGAGGGSHPVANVGVTRPGVGEPIRTLMERKAQWNNTIGPVVNYGKMGLPTESIFGEDKMKELENREVEIWNNEADE